MGEVNPHSLRFWELPGHSFMLRSTTNCRQLTEAFRQTGDARTAKFFSLLCCRPLWQSYSMTEIDTCSVTLMLEHVELLVAAMEANLNLLAAVVQPLLTRDDRTLTTDGEAVCRSLDNAIFWSGISAIDKFSQLETHAAAITHTQLDSCLRLHRRFDELTAYWKELMQAVHEAWKLGKPPH